jgi:hypothetical protein
MNAVAANSPKMPDPSFFERRHPEYAGKQAHWSFLEQTYYGGRDWFKSNIHRYFREGDGEYKDRVTRAYRFNHTREIVDLITKYIYKGEVVRKDDAQDFVQKFWKSTTKGGRDIDSFMRQVSQMTSVFGQPYIVMDSTIVLPEGEKKLSQADVERRNGRVYAYLVKPQDALDMSFDAYGKLNWILFREIARKDDNFFEAQETVTQYRLWTRTHWFLFEIVIETKNASDKPVIKVVTPDSTPLVKPSGDTSVNKSTSKLKVVLRGGGQHGLDEVPVIVPRERHSDSEYCAPGLIDDTAYLDRAVANYLSNLDAIIQDQTFSTLTIPAQALNSADSGDSVKQKILEMGTKRVVTYDAEAGIPPQYVSPDPGQVGVILSVVTKIITEIYHSVGMAGERTKSDNAAGIDNSSGVAKAYDFDRMNTMLKAKADTLQAVENDLVRLAHLWYSSKPPEDDFVRYPDDFDTRNLYDEFDVANRLALLDAPDGVRQHQMMTLIDKLFPNLTDELKSEIEKQIKKWPPEEVEPTSIRAPSRLQDRNVPQEENRQGQAGGADNP